MLKSSTGDLDSENLWSAAENDFSFFGEEGEEQSECGIYAQDPDKYFPTAHMDDKIALSSEEPSRENPLTNGVSQGPVRSPEIGSSLMRTATVLQSPRNLPLGRNRRSSSSASGREMIRGSLATEMTGSIPTSNPTSSPAPPQPVQEPMQDVVAELAKFRREKKAEHEEALLLWRIANNPHRGYASLDGRIVDGNTPMPTPVDERDMPSVEGHWKGEVKVIRNAAPKGRTGVVDMYGNYFENGYLYP